MMRDLPSYVTFPPSAWPPPSIIIITTSPQYSLHHHSISSSTWLIWFLSSFTTLSLSLSLSLSLGWCYNKTWEDRLFILGVGEQIHHTFEGDMILGSNMLFWYFYLYSVLSSKTWQCNSSDRTHIWYICHYNFWNNLYWIIV